MYIVDLARTFAQFLYTLIESLLNQCICRGRGAPTEEALRNRFLIISWAAPALIVHVGRTIWPCERYGRADLRVADCLTLAISMMFNGSVSTPEFPTQIAGSPSLFDHDIKAFQRSGFRRPWRNIKSPNPRMVLTALHRSGRNRSFTRSCVFKRSLKQKVYPRAPGIDHLD